MVRVVVIGDRVGLNTLEAVMEPRSRKNTTEKATSQPQREEKGSSKEMDFVRIFTKSPTSVTLNRSGEPYEQDFEVRLGSARFCKKNGTRQGTRPKRVQNESYCQCNSEREV